jgi:mono/diheme cytochrome c family protein
MTFAFPFKRSIAASAHRQTGKPRQNMRVLSFLGSCFLFLLMCPSPALVQTNGDAKAGKQKYDTLGCAGCHGATGKGDGPAAASLNPAKPRDFTNCNVMAAESDENLVKIIKSGGQSIGRSPMMPAWDATLNDEGISDLVAYIRSLCGK